MPWLSENPAVGDVRQPGAVLGDYGGRDRELRQSHGDARAEPGRAGPAPAYSAGGRSVTLLAEDFVAGEHAGADVIVDVAVK